MPTTDVKSVSVKRYGLSHQHAHTYTALFIEPESELTYSVHPMSLGAKWAVTLNVDACDVSFHMVDADRARVAATFHHIAALLELGETVDD